jgi:hypothetical protein
MKPGLMPDLPRRRGCAAWRIALVAGWLLATFPAGWAFEPTSLPPAGYQPGGIAYWTAPYLANAMACGAWIEYEEGQWGEGIEWWGSPQFDVNGFPRYLNPGRKLRATLFGLHCTYGNRPPTWPDRSGPAQGHVVLAWRGSADIRLDGGTYLAGESSGPAQGRLTDGRRVYRYEAGDHLQWLEIHDIDPDRPVTDIKVWLPDPADPANQSLENQLFHPLLLARLADRSWGQIRFMDWLETNGNPQQDWADRRRPACCFQTGVLNPRNPAPGVDWVGGYRPSGIAYEHVVALCNAADLDLWICVPHLATDDFVTRLARLIRFGSDGVEPYTSPQASPVYPPLAAHLRVFVEYSNEIWSGGWSFPQGEWAALQADALGISKAAFNARRFCQVWRIFQEVFGGADRLVRVAAVFTAADWYTGPFLAEMKAYGPTLSPAVEPDVIAATTYFGNGIQDWAHQRAEAAAGTSDPWFYTGEHFDDGGIVRSVARPPDDPYWTGLDLERHLQATFDEWAYRLLNGSAQEDAGPDAVGIGGGFDQWLRDLALTVFDTPKPIIAYEGGPSLYTDDRDGGDPRDDGLTTFMEALNRHPRMREVYRIHLDQARARGLWCHNPFVDCGAWGKYGQWGHLEQLDQDPASAVKYAFILDWVDEAGTLNHIDRPVGGKPGFSTPAELPLATVGEPYGTDVLTSGGDGPRDVTIVGQSLLPGLDCRVPAEAPGTMRVEGTPAAGGISYVYARVRDADGDPAWRTFLLRSVGAPGTLVESDLRGENPALSLPWTPVFWLGSGCLWSGWTMGAGATPRDGDNGLTWSVNAPGEEGAHTLAMAVADAQYLSVTFTPPPGVALDLRGAEVLLTFRRLDYHAPRRYALFAGPTGFTPGQELFASEAVWDFDEIVCRVILPQVPAYQEVAAPVEFRIYGYEAQWGGHRTRLTGFRLTNPVRPGDADGTGWVGTEDLVRLARYLAGDPIRVVPDGADVDGNGALNAVDLVRLLQLLSSP